MSNVNFLQSKLDNTKGDITNGVGWFNNCVAMNYENLRNLSDYIVDPNWIDSISQFFSGNYSEVISRIIVYPFNIAVESTNTNLILGGNTMSNIKAGTPLFENYYSDNILYRLSNITIQEHFHDFRDYNGYTNIRVFLPYYGFVDVSTNDVMGKNLIVELAIDFPTGLGEYFVCVGNDGDSYQNRNVRILSKHQCQIGVICPITQTNSLEVQRNLILGAASLAATLGASAYVGQLTGFAKSVTKSRGVSSRKYKTLNPKTNRLRTKSKIEKESQGESIHESSYSYTKDTMNSINYSATNALRNSVFHANTDNTMQPFLEQYGSKNVLVVIERPKFTNMGNYKKFLGAPLFDTVILDTLSGYTEIGEIHLENIDGITEGEKEELNSLLHSGVIL